MEKSIEKIEEMKAESKSMKPWNKTTRTFAETLSTVTASKWHFSSDAEKSTLGTQMKGLFEAERETGDAKFGMEQKKVTGIRDFWEFDTKMTKCSRIGLLKPDRGPRKAIIDLENDIDQDMLVKLPNKLKKYKEISTSIFISHEFFTENVIKENEDSKVRRDMIEKVVSAGIRRMRKLKLQKLVGEIWTSVLTVEAPNWLHIETATMYSSLNILQFKVKTHIALQRRTKLVNAFMTTIYNVICGTETWLTEDVPEKALFLQH